LNGAYFKIADLKTKGVKGKMAARLLEKSFDNIVEYTYKM
jgi:hypothetical protein